MFQCKQIAFGKQYKIRTLYSDKIMNICGVSYYYVVVYSYAETMSTPRALIPALYYMQIVLDHV